MKWITALITLFAATLAFATAQEYVSVKERLMKYREVQFDQPRQSLEAIKEHHNRRVQRLEEMLVERKQALADHKAGRRNLKSEEHDRYTRQLDVFQRKLDQLRQMTDEDHRETLETERHSFDQLKRMDYLNF